MKHTYGIKGMRCQSCVEKIREALLKVSGVKEAHVTLSPPEASIEMNTHVPLNTLNEAIKAAGDYSLSETAAYSASHDEKSTGEEQNLTPLLIIGVYLFGGVALRAFWTGDFSSHSLMANFMGGFFVLFSLFKMIDLNGFADGYSTYDVLAQRSRAYAITYPFIELTLGIFYFAGLFPTLTNLLTIIIMGISAVGVAKALAKRRAIQCACLGTALKLPMTKVTLLEDVTMGVMAGLMLLAN